MSQSDTTPLSSEANKEIALNCLYHPNTKEYIGDPRSNAIQLVTEALDAKDAEIAKLRGENERLTEGNVNCLARIKELRCAAEKMGSVVEAAIKVSSNVQGNSGTYGMFLVFKDDVIELDQALTEFQKVKES